VIRIPAAALDLLRRHGERTHPLESCGVLVGRVSGGDRLVSAAIPCANARRGDLRSRYEIDPQDLLRIQREARARGEEIIGFYHSHPDGAARPSATDLDEAHWLGCSFVITAVAGGQAGETASYLLAGRGMEDKRFVAEPLEVAPGAS
jgi:proteasome lid subunit RPN8/RPN11